MPPSFRSAPDSSHATSLFTSALGYLADAAVRGSLPQDFELLALRRGRAATQPPVAEAWIQALTESVPMVSAPAAQMHQLQCQLADWEEYAQPDSSEARLVLRLDDASGLARGKQPEDLAEGFVLDFMLRSKADPSLLVEAKDVWNDDAGLARWLGRPREVMLGALGKATRIYPAIREGLRAAQPTRILLDTEQTVEFLSGAAAELSAAGFEVLLPNWLNRQSKLKLKLEGTSKQSTGSDGAVNPVFGLE